MSGAITAIGIVLLAEATMAMFWRRNDRELLPQAVRVFRMVLALALILLGVTVC